MKTNLSIIPIIICLFSANLNVQAQSFWKQLGKAAEQAAKELVLPEKNTNSQQNSQKQEAKKTTDCNETLDLRKRTEIFQQLYNPISLDKYLTIKSFIINPQKLLYYSLFKEEFDNESWIYIVEKNDCKWKEIHRKELEEMFMGNAIDSIQIVTLENKSYLYYEFLQGGGNIGNYNIFFSLYNLDTYNKYYIDYEYYPGSKTSKVDTKFTPSENLNIQSQPVLFNFLFQKIKASPRVVIKTDKKTSSATINIPKTTGSISLNDPYNKFVNQKRITAEERISMKIDNIKTDDIYKNPNKKLSKGKQIYQGTNGKLITILVNEPDHSTKEYLVSYNPQGAYIDCIQSGLIMFYAGDRGASTIQGNKVIYKYEWSESGENGGGSVEYEITSGLKFVKQKEASY